MTLTNRPLGRLDLTALLGGDRRVKIVATIGPASSSPEAAEWLVAAGMDVARLNLSHGSHEDHAGAYRQVREASDRSGRAVGVLADLQGPKLRLERLEGGSLSLGEGEPVVVGPPWGPKVAIRVSTTATALLVDLRPGDSVLLADGAVELVVLSSRGELVDCRVVRGGTVRDHSGISAPGLRVSLPAITDKDVSDLRFALRLGVDLIALSFVRAPGDAEGVRSVMEDEGIHVPVIAKIERPEALERLDDLVEAFDGVMVARGDLGVEIPLESVPLVQSQVIALARRHAKPVIVATEMLDSMVERARPTRAEVSDVANAVLDGADALMLSAETSIGRHPVAATATMARVAAAASASGLGPTPAAGDERISREEAIARAAVSIGAAVGARALVAFTRTGASARLLAAQRPMLPVLAFTPDPRVRSQLALVWGVETFLESEPGDSDQMIAQVDRAMLDLGRAEAGDLVVVAAGTALGVAGSTNMLRVHRLGLE